MAQHVIKIQGGKFQRKLERMELVTSKEGVSRIGRRSKESYFQLQPGGAILDDKLWTLIFGYKN